MSNSKALDDLRSEVEADRAYAAGNLAMLHDGHAVAALRRSNPSCVGAPRPRGNCSASESGSRPNGTFRPRFMMQSTNQPARSAAEGYTMEIGIEQFVRIRDAIYHKLGLFFEDSKVYYIKRRVQARMEALGIADPAEYIFLLAHADVNGVEMQALANLVTTNETYMFREHEQLEGFANYCLPEVVDAKMLRGDDTLNIWSAGCSSGEEPYTLAIILREVLPASQNWNIQILATDIDQNMLALVNRARYSQRSVKDVPTEYRDRHLIRVGDEYLVHRDTAALVTPRHLNLHDRTAMQQMRSFDFIFCRNVLIYFDDASRKSAVDHFYKALNPGGFLFLGHSESVGRISNAFILRRMGQHLAYSKAA